MNRSTIGRLLGITLLLHHARQNVLGLIGWPRYLFVMVELED
jgi:hypothetical protein